MRLQILRRYAFFSAALSLILFTACGSGILDAFDRMKGDRAVISLPVENGYLAKSGIGSDIVIIFKKSMETGKLKLGGDLGSAASTSWSSTERGDDTLTLAPVSGGEWPNPGEKTLEISCEDINGNKVSFTLRYSVKDAVRCVSKSGNDSNDGSREHPFLTVQRAADDIKAISSAGFESAVLISGGTYTTSGTHVNISKAYGFTGDIVICGGYSDDWAELDPSKHETVLTQEDSSGAAVALINADNPDFTDKTVIKDLTLKGGSFATGSTVAVSILGDVVISNCRVYAGAGGSGSMAVAVFNPANARIEKSSLYMNRTGTGSMHAILVWGGANVTIDSNNIYLPETVSSGIVSVLYFNLSGSFAVTGNTLHPAPGGTSISTTGNYYTLYADLTLSQKNNTISNNSFIVPAGVSAASSYGCYIDAQDTSKSSTFTISGNTITGTGDNSAVTTEAAAVWIKDEVVDLAEKNTWNISGNTLTGTGKAAQLTTIGDSYGVYISNSISAFTISGNSIYGCGEGAEGGTKTSVRKAFGIYYNHSLLSASLTVKDNTIIAGLNRYSEDQPDLVSRSAGVHLNQVAGGSQNIISGNTIRGQLAGSINDNNGINGCSINYGSTGSGTSCVITGNNIKAQDVTASAARNSTGLYILNNAETELLNLTVSENIIAGGYNGESIHGLFLDSPTDTPASRPVISGNVITGCLAGGSGTFSLLCGLRIFNIADINVEGNAITGTEENKAGGSIYGGFLDETGRHSSFPYSSFERNTVFASRDKTAKSVTLAFGVYTTSTNPQSFSFFNNVISPGDAYYTSGDFDAGSLTGIAGAVFTGGVNGNIFFCNNTVFSGDSSGKKNCYFNDLSTTGTFQVHNNIFVMKNISTGVWFDKSVINACKNNCFYRSGTGVYVNVYNEEYVDIDNDGMLETSANVKLTGSADNVAENPLFASESGRDYSLTSLTPSSVRTGGTNGILNTSDDWFSYNDDITGTVRPSTGGWSMGAYQY